jgi:hypothetical protein
VDDGTSLDLVGVHGPFLLVTAGAFERYGCVSSSMTVFDLVTGRAGRRVEGCEHDPALPTRADPQAVTASGGPAWVRGGALQALDVAGRVVVLDRGPIADLRADGDDVVWRTGEVERRARL